MLKESGTSRRRVPPPPRPASPPRAAGPIVSPRSCGGDRSSEIPVTECRHRATTRGPAARLRGPWSPPKRVCPRVMFRPVSSSYPDTSRAVTGRPDHEKPPLASRLPTSPDAAPAILGPWPLLRASVLDLVPQPLFPCRWYSLTFYPDEPRRPVQERS